MRRTSRCSYLIGGTAKNLCRNKNRKARRVVANATHHRISLLHGEFSGFSYEVTIRCCVRPVSLGRVGRSPFVAVLRLPEFCRGRFAPSAAGGGHPVGLPAVSKSIVHPLSVLTSRSIPFAPVDCQSHVSFLWFFILIRWTAMPASRLACFRRFVFTTERIRRRSAFARPSPNPSRKRLKPTRKLGVSLIERTKRLTRNTREELIKGSTRGWSRQNACGAQHGNQK